MLKVQSTSLLLQLRARHLPITGSFTRVTDMTPAPSCGASLSSTVKQDHSECRVQKRNSKGAFTPDANEALRANDLHVKSMQRRDRQSAKHPQCKDALFAP